ncbi:MAG: CopL family metal-binding regulatory protein [Lysobacter sp.]
MSIRSMLLRLFLGLVLLLDGTATAVASVHMNHLDMAEATAQATSTASSDAVGEMPCHDADANGKKVATAAQPDLGEHEHESPDTGTKSPDCCESGACDCACLHPVQAAVVAAAIGLGSLGRTGNVRPMFPMHASPVLPHLIRPPIG